MRNQLPLEETITKKAESRSLTADSKKI